MGEETGHLEIFMNGEKFQINNFEGELIKIDQSDEMLKPATTVAVNFKVNPKDMQMALYKLTEDMSIFYKRAYSGNMRGLREVYKF